ncbi:hypothetical protein WDW86_01305 [Bdellovibrionota bacterium FG-2]
MLKFGKIAPRSLESFGVAGLLGEKCTVFYESLFSTKHIGRVSDLLAARLSQEGLDELEFRTLLLFSAFDGYRGSGNVLSSPMLVECGLDEEKVAVGVSFNLADSVELDPRAFAERIRTQKPVGEIEKLILEIDAHSDRLVVRVQPDGNRVEIVSLLGITGKIDPEELTNRQPPEVLVFDKPPQEKVMSGEYVQLGDLNYSQLLKDDAPGSKLESPTSGDVIALQMLDQINVGDEVVQVKGVHAEAERVKKVLGGLGDPNTDETLVKGGSSAAEDVAKVGGGSFEDDSVQKVKGSADGPDSLLQRVMGAFENSDSEAQKVAGQSETIEDKLFKVAGADGRVSQEAVMQALAAIQNPAISESAKLKLYRKQIQELQRKLQQIEQQKEGGLFSVEGGVTGALKKLFRRKGSEDEEQVAEKKKAKSSLFDGPLDSETAEGEESEDGFGDISIDVVDADGKKKKRGGKKSGIGADALSDQLDKFLQSDGDSADNEGEIEEDDSEEETGEADSGTLDIEFDFGSGDGEPSAKGQKSQKSKKKKRTSKDPQASGAAPKLDFSIEMGASLDVESNEEASEDEETEASGKPLSGDASDAIEKLLAAATSEDGGKAGKKKKKALGGFWPFGKKKTAVKAADEEVVIAGEAALNDRVMVRGSGSAEDTGVDVVSDKLLDEVSGGALAKFLERTQQEAADVHRELQGNPRIQKRVDGLMADLISEKSKLNDVSKKLSLMFRQKALEFKNREANLREEVRRGEDQIRSKNNALARAKEQLATTAANLERFKGSGLNAADEAALKHRYQLTQKTLAVSKEENARLNQKIQDMRNQLVTAQMGAKTKGPSFTEYQALKSRTDRLAFQCEEFKKANQQLQEQVNQANKAQVSGVGAAVDSANDEWKRKYEVLNKSAAFYQKENEQIKRRYDEIKREDVRTKMEVGRLQNELNAAKAASARGTKGFALRHQSLAEQNLLDLRQRKGRRR